MTGERAGEILGMLERDSMQHATHPRLRRCSCFFSSYAQNDAGFVFPEVECHRSLNGIYSFTYKIGQHEFTRVQFWVILTLLEERK
jgi:hypothetical protein